MPYLGFRDGKWIEHPQLVFEKRSRIKILLFDPEDDLPIETINAILKMAINLYN
jgi:predicted RNA binding protein YcfA (HicA-like mRNA interferase family)